MKPIVVTDSNFQSEVIESTIPVLVDFWATWCGPCKMIAPTVDEIASEYEGKIKVAKLNVDDYKKTANAYGVMSIPTLMIFKGGQVVDQIVGFVNKRQLVEKLNTHLG